MEGMRRARERALIADVVIVVLCIENGSSEVCVPPEVEAVLHELDRGKQEVIYVINKVDLLAPTTHRDTITIPLSEQLTKNHLPLSSLPIFLLSCNETPAAANNYKEQYKVQDLLEGLVRSFQARTSPIVLENMSSSGQHISNDSWAESLGASERHRVLLEQCLSHLNDFLEVASNAHSGRLDTFEDADIDVVVAAECLRNAADCLAKITGRGEGGDVEEVLGVVFEKSVQLTFLAAT
jgi:tRNA modification GTPase